MAAVVSSQDCEPRNDLSSHRIFCPVNKHRSPWFMDFPALVGNYQRGCVHAADKTFGRTAALTLVVVFFNANHVQYILLKKRILKKTGTCMRVKAQNTKLTLVYI